jgi:hypothetical protein
VLAGRSELGRGQSGNGDRAAPSRCALKPTDARHSMQSPRAARGGPNVQPRRPLCHRHEPDQETHSFCQIRPPPTAAEARLGSRTDVAFPSPARERHHLPKPAFWASEGLTRPPGLARLPRVGRGDWAVCRRDVTWR